MKLKFDREQNQKERLTFIRRYGKWMKSVPDEVWNEQQASLINSYLNSSKNFQLDRKKVSDDEEPFKSSHNPDEYADRG